MKVLDRLASSLIAAASLLVPRERRALWREEWEAELWAARARGSRSGVGFAAGAPAHALSMWTPSLLLHELKHALRFTRRSPAMSLAVVLLLAIGAGAPTTLFTIANAALLRSPGGVGAADGLVQFGRGERAEDFDNLSRPAIEFFRTNSNTLIDIAAYATERLLVTAPTGDRAVDAEIVTVNYFDVVRSEWSLGRGFLPDEEENASVVVIGHSYWLREFGGDTRVLGRSLRIRGVPFEIVGVAGPEYKGARIGGEPAQMWLPIGAARLVTPGEFDRSNSEHVSWLWPIGRMRPGVSFPAVRTELEALNALHQAERLQDRREEILVTRGVGLRPDERVVAFQVMGLLGSAVSAVLLIAGFNLAGLLLVRGEMRTSEFAIRASLGATRARLTRQLMLEILALGALGGVIAFLIARVGARGIQAAFPWDLTVPIEADTRTLVFALSSGIVVAMLFSLWPAWRSSRVDLQALLRRSSLSVVGTRGLLRSVIVGLQVALSCVLIACTGLLVGSVARLAATDPGFRTDGLSILPVQHQDGVVAAESFETVLAAAAPRSAAIADVSFLSGSVRSRSMWRDDASPMESVNVVVNRVAGDYFDMLGIELLRGRMFDARSDGAGSTPVAIVTRALAEQLFGSVDVVGRALISGSIDGELRYTIVGVVSDVRARSLREPASAVVFTPIAQEPQPQFLLHVRAPASDMAAIAEAVRRSGPDYLVLPAVDYGERVARSIGDLRLVTILCAILGVLAWILAFVGLYALLVQMLAARGREFGVRLALGARSRSIAWLILRHSLGLAAVGAAFGAAITGLALPRLQPWLYHPADAARLHIVGATLFILCTALIAALVPAVRATRVTPSSALKGGTA